MRSDVFAALMAIVGALLMAVLANPAVPFTLLLVSCAAWVVHGRRRRMWPLCAQMLVFGSFCLVGVWNTWLGPLVLG